MATRWVGAALAAAILGTAACGEGPAPLEPSPAGEESAVASLSAVVGVTVQDFFFSPDPVTVKQGDSVEWSFVGPSAHTATDNTGMSLYDSDVQDPGGTFSFNFFGAGTYKYRCDLHEGMEGTVKVPIKAKPATGGTGTTFTVTWSSTPAPAGFVFDVQILRPGASWVSWRPGETAPSATFIPDAGTGVYKFRALLRNTGNNKKSKNSPAKKITVS